MTPAKAPSGTWAAGATSKKSLYNENYFLDSSSIFTGIFEISMDSCKKSKIEKKILRRSNNPLKSIIYLLWFNVMV